MTETLTPAELGGLAREFEAYLTAVDRFRARELETYRRTEWRELSRPRPSVHATMVRAVDGPACAACRHPTPYPVTRCYVCAGETSDEKRPGESSTFRVRVPR